MGSGGLLGVDFGPRPQDTAAALRAPVVARARPLPRLLSDGWQASPAALLQVVGVGSRPRRRGQVGRKPQPRLVAPPTRFYAQVVKGRNKAGHMVEVRRRVVDGGPRRLGKQLRLRQGRTPRTPAMAIGLTDHGWSSRESLWLPVPTAPVLTQQMDERIARLLT